MGKGRPYWAKFAAKIDRRRLGAIAVLLLDTLFLATLLAPAKSRQPEISYRPVSISALEPMTLRFDATEDSPSATQTFYPYSVIPGGAKTPNELRNAVANDAVVRAHYANFVVSNARVERLEKTQAFYVSYRIGNAIFWTRNPMTLRAGETVLTDGSSMVRTRCGNRLSAVPLAPVSNIEPAPEAVESPEPAVLLASIGTPAELPIASFPMTAVAGPAIPQTPPPGVTQPGIFLPVSPFFPVFPVGAGASALPPGTPGQPSPPTIPPPSGPVPPSGPTPPPIPPSTPPPPATPPIATPEPSAILLLAIGLSCILLLKKLW
jgi:hypothetical protein